MIEVVTAGIDWLTATLGTGAVLDQEWIEKGLKCIDIVVKEGETLEYWRTQGYEGVKAGGCFVGTRADTHMIQFSGRYADMFFDETYRYDAHYSRIDVQTTVKHKHMPKRVAKDAYRDAIAENQTIPMARRRKIFLIVGSDGGDTLYVGSTSAAQRGRLYNKEVQSEDPLYSRTWRYEVVLRNEHATSLSGVLSTKSTNRAQFCSDWTAIWYQKRGIEVPWAYDETLLPLPPIKTLPTDTERKLNWLAHQVRPTVKELIDKLGRDAILTVLGLS